MKTSRELINEVGEWAEANFGHKAHPLYGIIEETGELTHCLLKRLQGIRGFDDPVKFKAEFTDALADIGIYLAHYCYLNNTSYKFIKAEVMHESWHQAPMEENIALVLSEVSRMLIDPMYAQVEKIACALVCIGAKENVDFETAVRDTWTKVVSKRDWKKNPVDANAKTI